MSISPINHNFKGTICLQDGCRTNQLDTGKILKFEAKDDGERTLIKYDEPREVRHSGYIYTTPTTYIYNYDINTVLNAYNAAKNSNIMIDLSDHKKNYISDYKN